MGSSHAVFILMSINLRIVGRALTASAALGPLVRRAASIIREEEDLDSNEPFQGCNAEDWAVRRARRQNADGGAQLGPDEFLAAASEAKQREPEAFVVLHLFAGAEREGSYAEHLVKEMAVLGLALLLVCVDIDGDARWDLARSEIFEMLQGAINDHLVDIIGGGPLLVGLGGAAQAPGSSASSRQGQILLGIPRFGVA